MLTLVITWLTVFLIAQVDQWATASTPAGAPPLAALEVDGNPVAVTDALLRWKEQPTGSLAEAAWEERLLRAYEQIPGTPVVGTMTQRTQWAAACMPLVASDVAPSKAKFLLRLLEIPAVVREADEEAQAGRTSPPVGWEIQLARALAAGRCNMIDDARGEIEALIKKVELASAASEKDGEENVVFWGREQTLADVLHQLRLQQATIAALCVVTDGGRFSNADASQPTESEQGDGDDKEKGGSPEQVSPPPMKPIAAAPTDAQTAPFVAAELDSKRLKKLLETIPVNPAFGSADKKFIALFEVEGNQLIGKLVRDQQAAELGLVCWSRINELFPTRYRDTIIEFNVLGGRRWAGFFSGDGSNDLGRSGYRLSVAKYTIEEEQNLRMANRTPTARRGTLDWTLVHEMGHYVCLRLDMIERFSREFDAVSPPRREAPDDYPADGSPRTEGNYVTSYAERAGGDEETCETFTTYLLLKELPQGNSLVAKKIRFIGNFPGMPELRQRIQSLGAKK